MATKKQKDEILFETKQLNALKLMRNKLSPNSKKRKPFRELIKLAEEELKRKRAMYKI